MVSNHDNIVKLYDKNETENEFQMYMEYCDKADSLTEKVREVSSDIFLSFDTGRKKVDFYYAQFLTLFNRVLRD